MAIDERIRGEAMGRRVVRTAYALEVEPAGLEAIGAAYRAALRPREARLADDHDPHYLHPGRTALILMLDTGERDPVVLTAATLAESERADLWAPDETVLPRSGDRATSGDEPSGPGEDPGSDAAHDPGPGGGRTGPDALAPPHGGMPPAVEPVLRAALALRARVPSPDDPDLVETLVVSEPALGLVAVAERLDHARHAHMWHEGVGHARLLDEYERVWAALVERVHPRLAQRFHRWARGTRRRLGR